MAIRFFNDQDVFGNATIEGILQVGPVGDGLKVDNSSNDYNVGIGTASPSAKIHVAGKAIIQTSGTATAHSDTDLLIANSTAASSTSQIQILSGVSGSSNLYFSDTAAYSVGGIQYDHTNNKMTLRVAAGSKMTILSSGNVGIGTSSPSQKLHIFNAGYPQMALESNGGTWQVGVSTGNDLAFRRGTSGSNYPLWLDSSDNVGVGTTSPSQKLDVAGNIKSNGEFQIFTGTTDIGQISNSSGALNIQGTSTRDVSLGSDTNPQSIFIEGTNGNVGIGTTSPSEKLEVAGAVGNFKTTGHQIFLTRNGNNEIYAVGASSVLALGQNGSEKMRIHSNGNVGIGTINPPYKLTVAGDTYVFNANLHLNSGYGIVNAGNTSHKIGFPSLGNFAFENVNVGIGTTSPDNILHIVKDQGGVSSALKLENKAGADDTGFDIDFKLASSGLSAKIGAIRTNSPGAGDTDMFFSTSTNGVTTTEAMRIDSAGNVGIGTTNPGYKLEISDDTDTTVNLLRLRNADSLYSQTWDFQLDTGKHLVVTGASGSGGIVLKPGSAGLNVTSTSAAQIFLNSATGNDSVLNFRENSSQKGKIGYDTSLSGIALVAGSGAFSSADMVVLDSGNVGIGTTSPGVKLDVTGQIRASSGLEISGGNINLVDNSRIRLGSSTDLQIYHDGSNSYIVDTGTGTLNISSNQINLNASNGENGIQINENADVKIRYDNSVKLQTTSTGVSVTGTATATTFSGDLNGTINTATTAVTKANATNDTTVATTAFVQNLIGTIPAGLVFQGTWDAATNTPTLTSGSGTTGHFYIVSTDGSTNLDGITDWKVGDWAVFVEQGATDAWEKVDNSSVLDGSGTGQKVALWSGSGTSNTLTDAPITVSGNNVGIGTTSPTSPLHVVNTVGGWSAYINNDVGTGTQSGLLLDAGSSSSDFAMYVRNAAGSSDLFSIKGNGNVGIGTTNPGAKLDVKVSSANLTNVIKFGDATPGYLASGTNGVYLSDSSGNARIMFEHTGNVGIGTTSPSEKLHVDGNAIVSGIGIGTSTLYSNSINITNSGTLRIGNTEFLSKSSNDLSIYQQKINVTSAGNVGVGTTSPAEKLTVSGDANITGKLAVGSSAAHPSFAFYNQLNAYFNGAVTIDDTLTQSGGGTSSFSGNVGIGTTSPANKLTVRTSTINDGLYLETSQPVTYGKIYNSNSESFPVGNLNLAYGTNSTAIIQALSNRMSLKGGYTTGGQISFLSASTEIMRMTSTGLGIGTTSPSQTLSVEGNIELGTGGYIYGDTTTPYLRLNNAAGAFLGYSTSYVTVGGPTTVVDAGTYVARFRSNKVIFTQPLFVGTSNINDTPTAELQVKGAGTTSATTALLVQNSATTELFRVRDDGSVYGIGAGGVDTNAAYGKDALISNTTGSNNVAVGAASLYTNTIGANNTSVGRLAIFSNSTGSNNTSIGMQSLYNNTTANNNSALGFQALYSNQTGGNNVAIGYAALFTNVTGNNNIAIGVEALINSTAANNTAIGYQALLSNTTGTSNVALGLQSLKINTTGSNNVALGYQSLHINLASNNTAVGHQTLLDNTTGANLVALGYRALYNNTTGSNNTALGHLSLFDNTTGSSNVAIGTSTLENNTASRNTAVGYAAMFANITGTFNVALGYHALRDNTASNNTAVGNEALKDNTTGAQNVGLGSYALANNTTAGFNTAVGVSAMFINTTGAGNVALGYQSLYSNTTSNDNTAIGSLALRNNTIGANNTAVGRQSLNLNTTGNFNTALGRTSLYVNTTGSYNTAVGNDSLRNNTASNLTAVGFEALKSNTTGYANVALGDRALRDNTTGFANIAVGQLTLVSNTGSNNTAVGNNAMLTNTSGASNVALGVESLRQNTTGNSNIAVGRRALRNNTANNNVAIGFQAAFSNTTGTSNVAVGHEALYNNTVSNNTALGYQAGYETGNLTGTSNTFLGYNASYGTATTITNSTAVGANVTLTNSNTVILGNNANVGIGTTSPSKKLHVAGSFKVTSESVFEGYIDVENTIYHRENIRVLNKLATNWVTWATRDTSGSDSVINLSNIGTITATGNVGIGTTSPGYKLDVTGDSTSGVIAVRNSANGRDTFRSENAAGTRTVNIGNDANGHGIVLVRGSSGTTNNYIAGNGNSYFNAGNVGIGTTSPAEKLHVAGDLKVEGDLHLEGDIDFRVINSSGFGQPEIELPNFIDTFWRADRRFTVTTTGGTTNVSGLFDGTYANLVNFVANTTHTITINVASQSGVSANGFTYPQGYIYISFYSTTNNYDSISGRFKDRNGVYYNMSGLTDIIPNDSNYKVMRLTVPSNNYAVEYELTLVTNTNNVRLAAINYVSARHVASQMELPYVAKTQDTNRLFGNIDVLTNASADQNRLSGTGNSYLAANTGNVGIGTTTPDFKLDVAGDIGIDEKIYHNGDHNTYIGFSADTQTFRTGGSDQVTINNTGVGIGTTSPSERLDVDGKIRARSWFTGVDNTNTLYSSTSTGVYLQGSSFTGAGSVISFRRTDGSIKAVVNTETGNVGIGTTGPLNKLQVTGGSIGIDSQYAIRDNRNNTILQQSANTAASNRTLTLGNATYSNIIIPNGNVGIGTTSPQQKLDVVGYTRTTTLEANGLTGSINLGYGANFKGGLFNDQYLTGDPANSVNDFVTYAPTKYHITVGTTTNKVITVDSSNNVDINGNIHVAGTTRLDSGGGQQPGVIINQNPTDAIAAVGITSTSVFLSEPDEWLTINIGGTDYVIPAYIP